MKSLWPVFLLLFLIILSCTVNPETKIIAKYLDSYGKELKDYKVICFVPADGCDICIEPSLRYSVTAENEFLLVLISRYWKSIRSIIEQYHLDLDKILVDEENKVVNLGLLIPTAPCFYFIKDGVVVIRADLSKTYDKEAVLIEVSRFIENSGINQ